MMRRSRDELPDRSSQSQLTRPVPRAVGSVQLSPQATPVRNVCQSYLSGNEIYSCSHCRAHLASHDEIISKSFQGHHGRAYLFNSLCVAATCSLVGLPACATSSLHSNAVTCPNSINIFEGPKEERILITGLHTVCDVCCNVCQAVLGWKYVS